MHVFVQSLVVLCLVVGLSITGETAPNEKIDCSKIEEVLDDLGGAQGITTLNDKYKIVTTVEEFQARCGHMTDAIKTLRKYNKECYSSLTQQVFSAILRTRSHSVEEHCKPDMTKLVVESTKCLQEKALEAAREAEHKTILASQVIHDANIADEKLRLRRSCCAVVQSKNYFMDAVKSNCSAHEKIYSDYVDSYTSESMALICPEAEKLECDKLEQLKLDGVERKSKFFLNNMLKLVKSLDH